MHAQALAPPPTSSPTPRGSKKGVAQIDLAGIFFPEGLKGLSKEEFEKVSPLPDAYELLKRVTFAFSNDRVHICSRADPSSLRAIRTNWVQKHLAPTGFLVDNDHLTFTDTRLEKGVESYRIGKKHEAEDHPLIVIDNSYDVGLAVMDAWGFSYAMQPGGLKIYSSLPNWIRFYLVNPNQQDLMKVKTAPYGMTLIEGSCLQIAEKEGW